MNLLCPEDIEWKFVSTMGLSDCHYAKYVNEEYGLEMETVTKKLDWYTFGKPKYYFFILEQEKQYTELQLLCDDWNEINDYDDPKNEIYWEKKIIKRRLKLITKKF